MNIEKLATLLTEIDLEPTPSQLKSFAIYAQELMEWNKKMNLTAILNTEEILIKHFYDSLLGMNIARWKPNVQALDLGTGAGFPGIPIKIIEPKIKMTLVDSLNKRVNFLNYIIEQLSLKDIQAIHGRAEDLGRQNSHRAQYGLVFSRAVAKLPVLLEYCLPFLEKEGILIAYKGPEGIQEVELAQKALAVLGGKVEEIKEYVLPEKQGDRMIIVIQKIKATPEEYPRKAGTPEKKPLR